MHAQYVRAAAACQGAGELLGGDSVELAAILFATTHGAVELTLSGHAKEEKGLGDPTYLVHALLARLRCHYRSVREIVYRPRKRDASLVVRVRR